MSKNYNCQIVVVSVHQLVYTRVSRLVFLYVYA